MRSVRLKEERQRIGTLVTPFNQSLIDVETQCLVQLSKAARAANEVQLALNSIVRAVGLEKPPSFDVFEEFANVLWCQKEQKIAVEYLGRLFAVGQGAIVRDAIEERRKALVYAQLVRQYRNHLMSVLMLYTGFMVICRLPEKPRGYTNGLFFCRN